MRLRLPLRSAIGLFLFVIFVLALTPTAFAAGKEKVLYSFQGMPDGESPVGGIVFDKAGNLYGSAGGGANTCLGIGQCGIIYQLKPPVKHGDPWTESVLYTFLGKNFNDAETPNGGVVIDQTGNLYGTTGYGGTGSCILLGTDVGCGTVYELSPPVQEGDPWRETILYSFHGGSDGYVPSGDLVFDAAGNLYGATLFGGGFSSCDPFYLYCGTIFELSPPKNQGGSWTEKVLYSFHNETDGAVPNGSLVFDKKGALYGTTWCGGEQPCDNLSQTFGVVFRLKPPGQSGGKWRYKVLHFFTDAALRDGFADGQNPGAGVILDNKGNLFGTTIAAGKGTSPLGTVFELSPPGRHGGPWQELILHTFDGFDGLYPRASLAFDRNGRLWGTALGGNFAGVIFRLKQANRTHHWTFADVYQFNAPPDDGYFPTSPLGFDNAGNLYSTTDAGGDGPCQGSGCGTVFEFGPTN